MGFTDLWEEFTIRWAGPNQAWFAGRGAGPKDLGRLYRMMGGVYNPVGVAYRAGAESTGHRRAYRPMGGV